MHIGEAYKDILACSITVRILASYNFIIVLSLKYLSIQRVKQRIKFVCVAMSSLVMSIYSCDVITIH